MHLKGRFYKRTALAIFTLVLIILVACAVTPWVKLQLAIDQCLDSGGAFQYETRTCKKN